MNLLQIIADESVGQAQGWMMIFTIALLLPLIIFAPILIFYIVTFWKLFKKAGRNGWEAIVPFYNTYVLTEISGQNGWLFLLTLIPGAGAAIWSIMVSIKLAPAFGKDSAFSIGLIFLPIIFYPILAFSNARYVLGGTPTYGQPTQPAQPDQPIQSDQAIQPSQTEQPTQPAQPAKPKDPWITGEE